MIQVSAGDVVDRYTILLLKRERTNEVEEEYAVYLSEVIALNISSEFTFRLLNINTQIWNLESDIRKGKEGELGEAEVARRALLIRDLNAQRVKIRNEINAKYGGFQEVKIDHASECAPARG